MSEQLNTSANARPEDEPLPFLSNFQDVFLTLGIIIFVGGISMLVGVYGIDMMDGATNGMVVFAGLLSIILAVVWALSEIIVRQRRRILPGIVLCLAFLLLTFGIFANLYGAAFGENAIEQIEDIEWTDTTFEDVPEADHSTLRAVAMSARDALPWSVKGFILFAPLFMLGMALVYYKRFRLPFSSAMVGLAVAASIGCVLFFASPYDAIRFSPSIGLTLSLGLLFTGISYDMRDPERVTRWSGNGFWFHFVAAPLLLSSALDVASQGLAYDVPAMIEGDFGGYEPFSAAQSVTTLVIIGIFAVISLLLNRRALVVAGLVSAAIAIGVLVNEIGLGGMEVAAITMILLGGGVLLLGLGWNAARRALLVLVPSGGFFGRVFPRHDVDG